MRPLVPSRLPALSLLFAQLLIASLLAASLQAAMPSLIMLSPADAQKIKAGIESKSSALQDFADSLRRRADSDLKKGPWSVTFHRPTTFQLDAHEYYSEAPYFWPDPMHPGKTIRKDGQRNPDRFDDNHRDLGTLCNAVLDLGAAAYFFHGANYAKKAAEDIRVWMEDPATRMLPNLEHGQAVLGANDGRGTGIIDTVSMIHCVQGMALLEASGMWEPEHAAAARKWIGEYMKWLLESKKGQEEGKSGNNHMTWYTAQLAAYASFTQDSGARQFAYKRFHEALMKEFEPSGAAPKEEARTNSLSYSTYNLDAFANLCRIAQVDGTDLWHAEPLRKAMLYIAPFVANPGDWKHQQIGAFKADGLVFPGLAGVALHDPALLKLHEGLKRGDDVWAGLVSAIVAVER